VTTVISAEDLGKKYLISHQPRERYTALRDVLASKVKQLGRAILHPMSGSDDKEMGTREEFWALRDVSFEISEGDRVGIIGRNGAGKSTLLKILSRITEPSTGRVKIKGRVASLLEVGTGFHPELTGRENIFLNGAILGMSNAEIRKKFDEIVAFAEVEKFLDTPVKHYSSGMYVRLAFAVAAHLEPDILIVDEVLAVGDAQFQRKCLGKMGDVAREGRTILFVTHNMAAVEQLCTVCLHLNGGRLKEFNEDVQAVVRNYLSDGGSNSSYAVWENRGDMFENPWFKPIRLELTDAAGSPLYMPVRNDVDIWVNIEGRIEKLEPALTVGYAIYSEDGVPIYWSYQTDTSEEKWPRLNTGDCVLASKIPARLLNEGRYKIELIGGLHFREWVFQPGTGTPNVELQIQGGLSDSPYWRIRRPGILAPVLEWSIRK
jgi:homopolymeric O-antigen transport system ATP-binding protein